MQACAADLDAAGAFTVDHSAALRDACVLADPPRGLGRCSGCCGRSVRRTRASDEAHVNAWALIDDYATLNQAGGACASSRLGSGRSIRHWIVCAIPPGVGLRTAPGQVDAGTGPQSMPWPRVVRVWIGYAIDLNEQRRIPILRPICQIECGRVPAVRSASRSTPRGLRDRGLRCGTASAGTDGGASAVGSNRKPK